MMRRPSRRLARHHLAALLLTLAPSSVSAAESTKLVLLPVGRGPALLPTVAVAQALSARLRRPGQRVVQLAYLAPESPEPADLKSQEKQGNKFLKKAFAAYDLMEYDKVKTQAGEALKIFKSLLRRYPSGSSEGYLTCLHLLAASALLQGDSRDAFQTMNDAVLFEARPPSKRTFNPSVQELFEQVRAEPAANGTLLLQSAPTALVWLNGRLQGIGAGRVSLRSGLYLVRLYAPGYAPVQRWVRVRAHQERSLKVTLTADSSPENENLVRLREELGAVEPGPALSQATLDLEADELVVVSAGKNCTATSCEMRLSWIKDGRWHRRRHAAYVGQPQVTAAALSGVKMAMSVPGRVPQPALAVSDGLRACTLDNQCLMDERCRGGRCVKPRSVTRTWWFWTLVGAATAGVALGIALPLTRPQGPVIEVR